MMNKEKVIVVVIEYALTNGWSIEDVSYEMTELVQACYGEVLETVICRIDRPTASFFIGDGKVEEITELAQRLNAQTVIFSRDLKGSQQRNLEERIGRKTIDRTQLILDIFARRATSQEGKMQVELAQLEYLLPRLVGKGIEMSRLGGGIGTLGPGETKLEVDRRRIGERITKLRRELKTVAADRAVQRKKRHDKGIPQISLVGYTNAGKSTLLNALTNAEQITQDGLFTTLDSLSRQFVLPNNQKIVISDTVGFINDLPHHLIEAFLATLEEIKEADILLHVLDVSNPRFRNLYESVLAVLNELDAQDKYTITVLNKIDRLEDKSVLQDINHLVDNPAPISAKTGENITQLLGMLGEQLSGRVTEVEVQLSMDRMDLVSLAHKEGKVYSIKYGNTSISLHAALPVKIAEIFYKANLKKLQ